MGHCSPSWPQCDTGSDRDMSERALQLMLALVKYNKRDYGGRKVCSGMPGKPNEHINNTAISISRPLYHSRSRYG